MRIIQLAASTVFKIMVQAWYMDDGSYDQREEHHKSPPEYVDLDDLFNLTGVEYFKVSTACCLTAYSPSHYLLTLR